MDNKEKVTLKDLTNVKPDKFIDTIHEIALEENKIFDAEKKLIKKQIALLKDEAEDFFDKVRQTNEYKKEFNKALKLYKLADVQEHRGAYRMQKHNIGRYNSFPEGILQKYPFIKDSYKPESFSDNNLLLAEAKKHKLALFLYFRDWTMVKWHKRMDLPAMNDYIAKTLAACDINTSELKNYRSYRLSTGGKVVAVKDETRKPLPANDILFPQIDDEMDRVISVAVKRFRQKTAKTDTVFTVFNNKATKLAKKYSELVKQDLINRPTRYSRNLCSNANDVIDSYFDENGHGKAKANTLDKLIIKEGVIVIAENNDENQR